MDQFISLLILCVCMFVFCYLCGDLPTRVRSSIKSMNLVSIFGAGLLVGVSLIVIIPEGVKAIYHQSFLKFQAKGAQDVSNSHSFHEFEESMILSNHQLVGVCLGAGFVCMIIIEQVFQIIKETKIKRSMDQPRGSQNEPLIINEQTPLLDNPEDIPKCDLILERSLSAELFKTTLDENTKITFIGLIFHCVADGFALGSAAYVKGITLGVIIFIALLMHKLPAAFGYATFLIHESYSKATIRKLIAIFAASCPIVAILIYLVILMYNWGSKESHEDLLLVGIFLLLSAGSFLYVATMHILPEVYCSSEVHIPHTHQHLPEEHIHDKQHYSKTVELLMVVLGIITPFVLTLIPHD